MTVGYPAMGAVLLYGVGLGPDRREHAKPQAHADRPEHVQNLTERGGWIMSVGGTTRLEIEGPREQATEQSWSNWERGRRRFGPCAWPA